MDFRLTGENEDMLALFEEFGKKVLEPWGPRAEAGEHPGEAIQAMAEAGGFVGNVTTMVTLPQITSAVDIPVVAAGGIADGKGLAAAIAMGASGVQMGTRFMLSKECTIPEVFKEAMIKAASKDAVAVHSKLRNGPALRVLRNKVVDDLLAYEKENHAEASVYEDKFDSSRYEHFLREGRVDELLLGMGEVAGSIHEILSVEDIINNMIKEYENIVKDMPSFS